MRVSERPDLGKLATFQPNKNLPVYRWFLFKEGFSRDLVFLLAETFQLTQGDLVLDPFCGSGTVPLACKQLGINCVSFDVHPVMLFTSRVKVRDYDLDEIKRESKRLLKLKFERPQFSSSSFIARFFPRHVLEDIVFFKEKIAELKDEKLRDFFLLALMGAAMRCSYAYKDGAALKVRERRLPYFRGELRRRIAQMCYDLARFDKRSCSIEIKRGDARKLELPDESVDAVITSPPYLGKTEYIYSFRLERELFLNGEENTSSFIQLGARNWEKNINEVKEVVGELHGDSLNYFADMWAVLKEMYRVCKSNSKVGLVASDGCSSEGVIEVCHRLSELAERVGFRAKKMIILNKRFCTTPSRRKLGITNESLLLWEKS
jgi:ubiquinone/menaquinone biosynthesis C-methylase UbiE